MVANRQLGDTQNHDISGLQKMIDSHMPGLKTATKHWPENAVLTHIFCQTHNCENTFVWDAQHLVQTLSQEWAISDLDFLAFQGRSTIPCVHPKLVQGSTQICCFSLQNWALCRDSELQPHPLHLLHDFNISRFCRCSSGFTSFCHEILDACVERGSDGNGYVTCYVKRDLRQSEIQGLHMYT